MIDKIDRQLCLEQFPLLPLRVYDPKKEDYSFHYPTVVSSHVLTIPAKSFKGLARQMGIELRLLTKKMESDFLVFLGDMDIPWLSQQSNYPPAKKAYDYFSDQRLGTHFCGGSRVDLSELPEFVQQLSWLTRCNATLPYIYFTDVKQNFIGNICQYGNLHLDILNKQAGKQLAQHITSSQFIHQQQNCYNTFSKTSAITGRALKG